MKDLRLYQIYYNEETRRQLDPGFIPLDNTANERPDWFEFLPIRRLLQNHQFHDETWIGIFSPKFFQKTGMSSTEVENAVQQSAAELVSFSPWFAHIALFKNIYEQGEYFHPGFLIIFKKFLLRSGLDPMLIEKPMTARQAIYSNYFVAPYRIWRKWLVHANLLYQMAEDASDDLGKELNYATNYGDSNDYPNKIFVMERIISLTIQLSDIPVDFKVNLQKCALGLRFRNTDASIDALTMLDEMKTNALKNSSLACLSEHEALSRELLLLKDVV